MSASTPTDRRQRAAELYADGWTMAAIAQEMGVTGAAVSYWLKTLGVPRRGKQTPARLASPSQKT